ncbi:VOC family protein [uncultured Aquimarina sp.]|uniref:VOC family protein n=1 Tax=uncultured Aquimarina sp. TaxID=575652 RepID=UPI002611311A|nr:VOC family protein [uncultured Aquimarina sp.]
MLKNKIKGLGEVILLVNNIETVKQFYKDIIGLEIIAQEENYVFFKIADGTAGHPQVLGLFDNSIPTEFGQIRESPEINKSSLHHLALEIDLSDYESIVKDLKKNEIQFKTRVFNWIQWRSIYLLDPEMNVVELVCFDSTIEKK